MGKNPESNWQVTPEDVGVLAFRHSDKGLIGNLRTAVDRLRCRPKLAPKGIHQLAVALLILDRIPRTTEDCYVQIGLTRWDSEQFAFWMYLVIDESSFELTAGERVPCVSGGTESHTAMRFYVEDSGFRTEEYSNDELREWGEHFIALAETENVNLDLSGSLPQDFDWDEADNGED